MRKNKHMSSHITKKSLLAGTLLAFSMMVAFPAMSYAVETRDPEYLGGPLKEKTEKYEREFEKETEKSERKTEKKDKATASKACRAAIEAARNEYRATVKANDKVSATAIKLANTNYKNAVKTATEARKAAVAIAKELEDKDARKAAIEKAQADYKVALKAAQDARKAAKDLALSTRKSANSSAQTNRDAKVRAGNQPCATSTSNSGSVLGAFTSLFHF